MYKCYFLNSFVRLSVCLSVCKTTKQHKINYSTSPTSTKQLTTSQTISITPSHTSSQHYTTSQHNIKTKHHNTKSQKKNTTHHHKTISHHNIITQHHNMNLEIWLPLFVIYLQILELMLLDTLSLNSKSDRKFELTYGQWQMKL